MSDLARSGGDAGAGGRTAFWLSQLIPPSLLAWLGWTDSGPGIFFLSWIFALVCVFSLFRIGYLVYRKRALSRQIRPLAAAIICAAVLVRMTHSLGPARVFARQTAERVQARCDAERRCPAAIEGWVERHGSGTLRIVHEERMRWPLLYESDGDGFTVVLYKGPDMGECWGGGVGKTLDTAGRQCL